MKVSLSEPYEEVLLSIKRDGKREAAGKGRRQ